MRNILAQSAQRIGTKAVFERGGWGAESAAGGLQAAGAWLDLFAGSGRRDCERWGEETPCQGCFLPYPWLVAPQTVGSGGKGRRAGSVGG
jgi:hypothetical protein